MKSEITGCSTTIHGYVDFGLPRKMMVSFVPAYKRSEAGRQYVKNRYNGVVEIEDLPLDVRGEWETIEEAVGKFDFFIEPGKSGYYRARFTEGPLTKAWMEEQDRKYLREIAVSNPRLFLKEMTPRSELSEHDQRAKLGLKLGFLGGLKHHKELLKEFAGDVARIKASIVSGAIPRIGMASVPIVTTVLSAADSSASSSDSVELSRLRTAAKFASAWRDTAGQCQPLVARGTLDHPDTPVEAKDAANVSPVTMATSRCCDQYGTTTFLATMSIAAVGVAYLVNTYWGSKH